MKTFKKQVIQLPHFNYTVRVEYVDNVQDHVRTRYPKVWSAGGYDDGGLSARAFHLYEPVGCVSVIVFNTDPQIKTIAHEVFHAVWRIMKHIGSDLENEVMAYHMGYLVERITSWLYKHGDAYADMREMNRKKSLTKKRIAGKL